MIYKSYYPFLMAPRGTPSDIIVRYNKDINDILHNPSFQPRLDALGLDAEGGTPEEFGKVWLWRVRSPQGACRQHEYEG